MNNDLTGNDTRPLSHYLHDLRSGSPTPGGGSAAAYTGALGAALLAMVCRLTLQSAAGSGNTVLGTAADRLDDLVDRLSLAAREDELCYGRYRAAAALPKASDDEKQIRRVAMQAALERAARSPLASANLAIDALNLAPVLAREGTIHALSDVRTALELLPASVRGSLLNVDVNISMITDAGIKHALTDAVTQVQADLESSTTAALDALRDRAG